MMKCMVEAWDARKDTLRARFEEMTTDELYFLEYINLVKMAFDFVYNKYADDVNCANGICKVEVHATHEIDDGNCQGTLVYLVPFETYQPSEYEYIMTYADYGSCSACDTLLAARSCDANTMIADYMEICKDLLMCAIKPYNSGWREESQYNHV